MTKTGVDISGLGVFFLEQSFRAVLIVDPNKAALKNKDIAKHLPSFLSLGGELIRRSVVAQDIEDYTKNGYPAIINVVGAGDGHFVVIRNVGKKTMTINDPWSGSLLLGKNKVISECHAWTGAAMFVFPKAA